MNSKKIWAVGALALATCPNCDTTQEAPPKTSEATIAPSSTLMLKDPDQWWEEIFIKEKRI